MLSMRSEMLFEMLRGQPRGPSSASSLGLGLASDLRSEEDPLRRGQQFIREAAMGAQAGLRPRLRPFRCCARGYCRRVARRMPS